MSRYYYDFHVHSCLSPCADDDNTPNNLAGMAALCGINIMALTDHNSCKNCPAFFEAAKRNGIIPSAALEFDKVIDPFRTPFPNRVDIFGHQMIMDGDDNVIGTEKNFLPVATAVDLNSAVSLVKKHGGICYPAHIDRQANGIISILGTLPVDPEFSCVEFHSTENREEYTKLYSLENKRILVGSDTHYLTDIRDENDWLLIDDEPYSSSLVRQRLFEMLR